MNAKARLKALERHKINRAAPRFTFTVRFADPGEDTTPRRVKHPDGNETFYISLARANEEELDDE